MPRSKVKAVIAKRKCEECKNQFQPRRKWQRFCSEACRWDNWFNRTYRKVSDSG